uniref:Uncharacterized protein n=1 Tax=Plectus sambesii TaxID=2011161 RepID=A0A914W9X9_9BILA
MALDLSISSSTSVRLAGPARPKLFRPYELVQDSDDYDKRRNEEAKILDHHRQQQQQAFAHQQAMLMHVGSSNQCGQPNPVATAGFGFAPIWLHGRLFGGARKPHRPLCGRYVRSGPAASQSVLVALRKKVIQRQQMKYWALILRINQHQQQANNCGFFASSTAPLRREFDCALPQPQ